jgi:hypothetical protein
VAQSETASLCGEAVAFQPVRAKFGSILRGAMCAPCLADCLPKEKNGKHPARQSARIRSIMLSGCCCGLFLAGGKGGGCCRRGALLGGHCNIMGPYATFHFAPLGGRWFGGFCPWFVAIAKGKNRRKKISYPRSVLLSTAVFNIKDLTLCPSPFSPL